jgi:hypothetical protein
MVSFDTNIRITKILKGIEQVKERVDQLIELVEPEEDLWDNSDIIRHWKVSERTLADWRSKGLINYVQVGGKIWYPQEARESFIKDHQISVQQKMAGGKHGG